MNALCIHTLFLHISSDFSPTKFCAGRGAGHEAVIIAFNYTSGFARATPRGFTVPAR